MMHDKTIYKYQLSLGSNTVRLPVDSKVVLFAEQHNNYFIWFEHTTDTTYFDDRVFEVFGTGHLIPKNAKHIGSLVSGSFVWHLYEVFE